MAVLANGLETLEVGATAWRLIVNANIEKLYSKTECDSTFVKKSGSVLTGFLTLHADPTAVLHPASKQYVDYRTAVYAATVSAAFTPSNMNVYSNFYITLGNTIAINNPTNHWVGQSGSVVFKQDATGSRTITSWGSYYLFPGGVEPTLSTTPGAIDTFKYVVISSTEILITNFLSNMS